ncbi:hypothetical protein [Pseudonocardia nigra]|uniref:hypothetical protein n=1 Tax=Pseudonocardia nigra TaxID=1921578 RepID=UPI001C5F6E7E|nr:hypothetical protein [Pseudonocardia nigra]
MLPRASNVIGYASCPRYVDTVTAQTVLRGWRLGPRPRARRWPRRVCSVEDLVEVRSPGIKGAARTRRYIEGRRWRGRGAIAAVPVTVAYPFSGSATAHRVQFDDGPAVWAMCGGDAAEASWS